MENQPQSQVEQFTAWYEGTMRPYRNHPDARQQTLDLIQDLFETYCDVIARWEKKEAEAPAKLATFHHNVMKSMVEAAHHGITNMLRASYSWGL
jgi:hypothetical protein